MRTRQESRLMMDVLVACASHVIALGGPPSRADLAELMFKKNGLNAGQTRARVRKLRAENLLNRRLEPTERGMWSIR